MILTLVKQAIKSPAKAAELKSALLEVRDEVSMLYPGE